MTFGKYVGQELEEIPDGYLVWLLDNVRDLNYFLREAIEERLSRARSRRSYEYTPPSPQPPPAAAAATVDVLAEEVRDWIRSVYREMSARFHPDHGGSNESMIAVNLVFERLRETMPFAPGGP